MVIASTPVSSTDFIYSFTLVSLSFWSPWCLPCISLSHYYISVCIILVAVSCCPLKESFHLRFFTLTTMLLWHIFREPSHFGEGAYAIMIIIIKKILMCLVFATQLLIMAWAPCRGRGSELAAKTDSARRPPPTCPEVSGLVEVTPTYLPALCWTGGGTAQNIKLEEMNCVMWSEVRERQWMNSSGF